MRVQANSFRLPVLRLQPRDVSKHISQEPNDYNQSNSSIKYQSSPLRDGAPIKKRVRGMTIAIYNSQEKLKTSEYRYNNQPSEFITQSQHNINNNSSLNTVRRYRSKLKQMMYGVDPKAHPEELSRDPRIYSFKEPAATIRLTKLNEIPKEDSMAFKQRVKMLMAKIQMLLQSQSFYQAPKAQESFKVTLVKLRDEYDCLYEDFNDFYVTKKQLDQQVLGLLNHMEIIKKLLKPTERKQVILSKPQSQANFQIEPESIVEVPIEKSEVESILVMQSMDSQPSRKPSSVIYEAHVDTPISSTLFRGEETQSEFSETNPLGGEASDQSPGLSPKRRNKSRTKINRTPKSDLHLQLQSVQSNSRKKIQSNYDDDNLDDYNDAEQSIRLISNRRSSRQISRKASSIRDEPEQAIIEETPIIEENNNKSPLKRTISNMGSVSKKRSTIILVNETKKLGKKKRSGARTISERDDSQFDSDEEEQEDQENNSKIVEEEKEIIEESNTLLDKLISTTNIYSWQYFQTWDYHIDQIIDGRLFGEYDL